MGGVEKLKARETISATIRQERALNEVEKRDPFGKVVVQTD